MQNASHWERCIFQTFFGHILFSLLKSSICKGLCLLFSVSIGYSNCNKCTFETDSKGLSYKHATLNVYRIHDSKSFWMRILFWKNPFYFHTHFSWFCYSSSFLVALARPDSAVCLETTPGQECYGLLQTFDIPNSCLQRHC